MEKLFEHSALEQDIQRISAEIKSRGVAEKGREAVKTVVQEQIRQPASPAPVLVQPPDPLPSYMATEEPEVKLKVEKLLDLAFHKGLKRAADEARVMNPIIMDAFHDALTDKLYNELKQRGILK